MRRQTLRLASFALLGLGAASLDSQPVASAGATPSYTSDQAWQGRLVYYRSCAECHGGGLQGQFGPALAGGGDRVRFESAKYVYGYYSVFMPHGNPGALTREQYVDVMAFLFQQHGRPAGLTPLTVRAIDGDANPVGP